MRLINTTTLRMSEFSSENTPQYAILSHTWQEGEEVSFADYQQLSNTDGAGFKKIVDCCSLASKHGLQWAWIDTCCIDKTSSTELVESINSMFRWYQRSAVCFVFLQDLGRGGERPPGDHQPYSGEELARCRWFKRGWTLQELLAPHNILFYDRDLHQIGTKASLKLHLAEITRIDLPYLETPMAFRRASVAQRMSWASGRVTTREEDSAYSLIGLFDVNMPLMYGEGPRAFLRLQLEIMSQTNDDSIFAWLSDLDSYSAPHGLLARSVADFRGCGDIVCVTTVDQRAPSIVGKREIDLPYSAPTWADLFGRRHLGHVDEHLALPLRCVSACGHGRIVVHLIMAKGEQRNNTGSLYYRRRCSYQTYTGGTLDVALSMCSMVLFPQGPCRVAQELADDLYSPSMLRLESISQASIVVAARSQSYIAVFIATSCLTIISLIYHRNAPVVWACATLAWTFSSYSRVLLFAYLLVAVVRGLF